MPTSGTNASGLIGLAAVNMSSSFFASTERAALVGDGSGAAAQSHLDQRQPLVRQPAHISERIRRLVSGAVETINLLMAVVPVAAVVSRRRASTNLRAACSDVRGCSGRKRVLNRHSTIQRSQHERKVRLHRYSGLRLGHRCPRVDASNTWHSCCLAASCSAVLNWGTCAVGAAGGGVALGALVFRATA